jgi:hypothetical protein
MGLLHDAFRQFYSLERGDDHSTDEIEPVHVPGWSPRPVFNQVGSAGIPPVIYERRHLTCSCSVWQNNTHNTHFFSSAFGCFVAVAVDAVSARRRLGGLREHLVCLIDDTSRMADVLTTEVLIRFSPAAEEVIAATSIAKKRRSGRH